MSRKIFRRAGAAVAALASVALGAVVIEKHFTLRREDGGVDAAFSLEPEELAALVLESGRAWEALGHIRYGISDAERASTRFRRSLYVVKDIEAGESITEANVRAIRPGYGLSPKFLEQVLGMRVLRSTSKGTPLSWQLFHDLGPAGGTPSP